MESAQSKRAAASCVPRGGPRQLARRPAATILPQTDSTASQWQGALLRLSASSSVEEVAAFVSDALTSLLREWRERPVGALRLQILTLTQCVMDRASAFHHWRDRQGLDQAVLVAAQQPVDLDEIELWSMREGQG